MIVFVFTLISGNAVADSFRCGNSIVKSSDSTNTLLKKCGSPQRKYVTQEAYYEHGYAYSNAVTNWVYERPGQKDMIVSVRNGAVVKIQPD